MASAVLESAWQILSAVLNNIVVAAIVVLIGFIGGRLAGKLVSRVLDELEFNRLVHNITRLSIPADEILGYLSQFFIYFLAIIIALDTLRLRGILFDLASALLVVIILISMLLFLKDFIPNVFAGVVIHQAAHLREGDHVRIGDLEGVVDSVNLVDTRIHNRQGDVIFVPNTFVMGRVVLVRKRR